MADDPQKRLEDHAAQPVPPVNPDFANRLESKLRVEHATVTTPRRWAARSVVPRALVAGVLAVAGIAGVVALTSHEAGVPVAVIDDEQPAALDAPAADDGNPADATPTPTATPTQVADAEVPVLPAASPTATAVRAVEPTETTVIPAVPTATSLLTQSTVPLPSATPTVPPATPVPATATPVPSPTATTTPEQTPSAVPQVRPTPTPTATPTPENEPAPIELACGARRAGDAVGVVCSWDEPAVDRLVVRYEVVRSRNGGEIQVISRQRANAPTSYIDRDVEPGDEVTYLVRALDADGRVIGASIRQIVVVP